MNGRIVLIESKTKDSERLIAGAKDIMEGKFYHKPIVGNVFMIGVYHTSKVTELLPNNQFKTENSTYQLQLWW